MPSGHRLHLQIFARLFGHSSTPTFIRWAAFTQSSRVPSNFVITILNLTLFVGVLPVTMALLDPPLQACSVRSATLRTLGGQRTLFNRDQARPHVDEDGHGA
ncbi:hypothetical protein C8Q76DRAFT_802432 [Earliella scabrosa]|nr:hypothetical protein C8Q76DRAFT_802432 [Earliella scabrosa]